MSWMLPASAEGGLMTLACVTFPDLAPWLDSVSDDYDELPSEGHDVPYDE